MSTKKEGFTLAELLIVVAVIGVLVSISVPIFSGQVKKAKASADTANVRSAKVAALAEHMLGSDSTKSAVYFYDASTGRAITDIEQSQLISGYGKSTEEIDDHASGIPNVAGKPQIVKVTIQTDGTAECSWHGAGSDAEETPDQNPDWNQNYAYKYDAYQNGTKYNYGDVVEKDGVLYMYVSNGRTDDKRFAPGEYNEDSLRSWRAVGTADQSAISYSINTRYAVGTIVSYNGKTYMFTPPYNDTGYSNNYPDSDGGIWTEMNAESSLVKPPVLSVPAANIPSTSSVSSYSTGQYYSSNGEIYQYKGNDGGNTGISYNSVKDGTWTQVSNVYKYENARYQAGDTVWYKGISYVALSDFTTYIGGQFEPDKLQTAYWRKA